MFSKTEINIQNIWASNSKSPKTADGPQQRSVSEKRGHKQTGGETGRRGKEKKARDMHTVGL